MRLALFIALCLASSAQAATYCVRAGATGANNGSDWDNAFTSLNVYTLVRGSTYYVADGAYDSAGSQQYVQIAGTAYIVIKKATESDHGPSTGWSTAYGDGQALFYDQYMMYCHNVEWDGVRRNESNWEDAAAYGFYFPAPSGYGAFWHESGVAPAHGWRWKYVAFGPAVLTLPTINPNCTKTGEMVPLYIVGTANNNVLLSRCLFRNVHMSLQVGTSQSDNWIMEYCAHVQTYSKEVFRATGPADGWIIRHNFFKDNLVDFGVGDPCEHGGGTADIGQFGTIPAPNRPADETGWWDNWQIYGNTWLETGAVDSRHNNAWISVGGDAIDAAKQSGWRIYNNVYINPGLNAPPGASKSLGLLLYGPNHTAYNNVWFNADSGASICVGCTIESPNPDPVTYSHNWVHPAAKAFGNSLAGTADPFTDSASGDARPADPATVASPDIVNAGITLGSGYDNVDRAGNVRGAQGAWDIGVFEFSGIPGVAAPTFSPAAGSYSGPQSVTISSATAGSTIRYTLDGTTPTVSSTVYSSPIAIGTATTIKAYAAKVGSIDSSVSSASYTFSTPSASAPVMTPQAGVYDEIISVSMYSPTVGAEIRYTLDNSEPSAASTLYSGAVTVSSPTTIKAIASTNGYLNSAVVSNYYNVRVAPVEFSPVGGDFTNVVYVSMSSDTTNVTIFYTRDGSTPTALSSPYLAPTHVTATTTLKAIAIKGGFGQSAVSTDTYTIYGGIVSSSVNRATNATIGTLNYYR